MVRVNAGDPEPAGTGGAAVPFETFASLDIRVARVINAEPLENARKPAFVLRLDCGPALGERTSTAQLTDLYGSDDLVGRLVLAVVNLPPRRVAGVKSECLTLGVYASGGRGAMSGPVALVEPDASHPVVPGDRLG